VRELRRLLDVCSRYKRAIEKAGELPASIVVDQCLRPPHGSTSSSDMNVPGVLRALAARVAGNYRCMLEVLGDYIRLRQAAHVSAVTAAATESPIL
jgi:hypothetical protein